MQHNYTKGGMIGLAVAFMVLPLMFMSLRIWAKLLAKRFAWDDYLAIGALVSRHPRTSRFSVADRLQLVSMTCCILQLASKYVHGEEFDEF